MQRVQPDAVGRNAERNRFQIQEPSNSRLRRFSSKISEARKKGKKGNEAKPGEARDWSNHDSRGLIDTAVIGRILYSVNMSTMEIEPTSIGYYGRQEEC